MAVDDLVDRILFYRRRPVWQHFYVTPFFILYAVWIGIWLKYFGPDEHFDIFCIGMAILCLLQTLTVLFCNWFIGLMAVMTSARVKNVKDADVVLVYPTANNGWPEIVPIYRSKANGKTTRTWFSFQKVVYEYRTDEDKFTTRDYPVDKAFAEYRLARGYENDIDTISVRIQYGSNKMEMYVPQFGELFKERATAPFFVFQVFTVGLWCLDDMWYYSLFTLAMLVVFEATLVKQQMRNFESIRNMGNKDVQIQVYRNRKWAKISSDDLIPGDLVSIKSAIMDDQARVPCDLLLVRGRCIVDESMLTGESVPQPKEPLEELDADTARATYLDIDMHGRMYVLYGGTRVVQHTQPAKQSSGIRPPDGGCLCYVLRTGFSTAQGRLLRTIMFGVKRVTANNLETFAFILFLLIFAIAAAAYVWVKGSADVNRNKYKLALECALILTSVIPHELPIELALAVNNSLLALQQLGVYCTEPFRIPMAGKIDVCCFDKTGTLTTDSLVVDGIAGLTLDDSDDNDDDETSQMEKLKIVPIAELADQPCTQVLATCHALMAMENRDIVGDPMEKVCLAATQWKLTRNEMVVPPKTSKQPSLRIFQRWHFSSELKRMAVICGYQQQTQSGQLETQYIACIKGAPEVVKTMLAKAPANFDNMCQRLTRQGARVLALAHMPLGTLTTVELREMRRDDIERNLAFAGFVVISCPLKPDSKAILQEIQNSSHSVVMITGDSALTACHVARELRMTPRKHTLLLDTNEQLWTSVDGRVKFSLRGENKSSTMSKFSDADLCLTGDNISYLLDNDYKLFCQLLPHTRIYARMAPKQKERVVNELRRLGFVTLMCGDGTNDVGALKHANVGVALLAHPPLKKDVKRADVDAQTSVTTTTSVKKLSTAPRQQTSNNPRITAAQKRMEELMQKLDEEEQAQVVRLGDASIAAPFTSRYSSIQSICHVIKQGRCTLVTTLQMFKILALNALVLAYSQSVLYLDGIKFSNTQATVQGLLLAACFLFISRSKPLSTLSRQRPMSNIFNVYTLATVTFQFAVHLACLLTLSNMSRRYTPYIDWPEAKIDLDRAFSPSLLNSSVYIMSMTLQIVTFAVNYRGRPFMESLLENKALLYSILASGGWILMLSSGMQPDINTQFELVEMPKQMRDTVLIILIVDFIGCFLIDRTLNFLFGDMRPPRLTDRLHS